MSSRSHFGNVHKLTPRWNLGMFAVGHAAYGYLLAKATAKPLKTDIHVPLVLALSVIPDIDLLVRGLPHRGATHSLIVITLLSIPFLAKYGAKVLPYLVALTQHSFLGDYLTGGSKLLYPVTTQTIGLRWSVIGTQNQILEWTGLILLLAVLLGSNDIKELLKPRRQNLLLLIPAAATLATLVARQYFRYPVPTTLVVPEIALTGLYAASVLSTLAHTAQEIIPWDRTHLKS